MKKAVYFCCIVFPILLASCGPLMNFNSDEKAYFVITDDGTLPKDSLTNSGLRVLVRDTKANGFVNSRKIIFSENPATQAYYQFAQWVEPPTDRVTLLIVQRLERAGLFTSVSRLAGSALGDIQLSAELTDFYHDLSAGGKGVVRLRLNCELINLRDHTVLQSREFAKIIPVEDYSARGAVQAFSVAVNEVLNELVQWMNKAANDAAPSMKTATPF